MKKKKFLDKMVNLVEKSLKKTQGRPLNEQITIYWNYEDMTMSLYHDTYGFAGTYTLEDLYKRFSDLSVKIKVKECGFCIEYARYVLSDMKMFIREKKNPIIVKTPLERTIYIDKNLESCDELVDDELCEECDCNDDCHTCEGPICFSNQDTNNNVKDCTTNDEVENSFEDNNDETNRNDNDSLDFPDVEKADLKKINDLMKSEEIVCPQCGSNETRKNGRKAGKQRWICKNCNRYFTGDIVS